MADRVKQESDATNRFQARAAGGLTPFVGREEEIGLLLERWDEAKNDEGQVVLLSGEPGIGKSRIVQSFQERLRGEVRNRLLYFCAPYHQHTVFHPVIDQLERGLRFDRADGAEQKLDKLEAVLNKLGLPVTELASVLAALLSLAVGERYPRLDLGPEQLRRKTLEALLAYPPAMAAQYPVLMVFEDAHWSDPSTLEFLGLMVERIRSIRALLVLTYRPEFECPWEDDAGITSLNLKSLSRRASAEIVASVTGNRALPGEVFDQILAKTDGVPLFIEELTRVVLAGSLLRAAGNRFDLSGPLPHLAIPSTLQESLMARLDHLGPIKRLAQVGATIGRDFSYELLAAVSDSPDSELKDALGQLVQSGLVFQRGRPPQQTYMFKHALVQATAYETLPHAERRQTHARIATVLEQRFPQKAESHPELFAHHYREAALPQSAIPYAVRAGDVAAGRYAVVEARARYQAALEMAQSMSPSEDASRSQIQAILKIATVAMNRQHFESDLTNLQHARTLAEEIDDQPSLCQIHYWIGRTYYVIGNFELGVECAERSLQLAESLGGDDEVTSGPVNLLARLHCLRGEPRKAVDYGARSVEQMHKLGNRLEEAAVSGVLAFGYAAHGRFAQAFEAADHGVQVAKDLDHLPTLAASFHFRGVVKGWHGELQSSVANFEEVLAISAKSGDIFRRYLAHGWRGEACLLADSFELAKADLMQCLALGDEIGTSFHRGAFEAFLAKVRLLEGDVEGALETADRALAFATEPAQAWSRSIALRIQAEVLLAADPLAVDEAEDAIRAAIDIQERQECRCDLAWSRLALGHILVAKADTESAKEAFSTAARLFEEMSIARGREKAGTALATLG